MAALFVVHSIEYNRREQWASQTARRHRSPLRRHRRLSRRSRWGGHGPATQSV